MSLLPIEKNVPKPHNNYGRGRPRIYPFRNMKVGDSFTVPPGKHKIVSTIASRWHKDKFTVLKCTDGLYRCWRIK